MKLHQGPWEENGNVKFSKKHNNDDTWKISLAWAFGSGELQLGVILYHFTAVKEFNLRLDTSNEFLSLSMFQYVFD